MKVLSLNMSKEDWNTEDFVLDQVKKNGKALYYASRRLKNTKHIVLAAIQQTEGAIPYVSYHLLDDKEVIQFIVQNYVKWFNLASIRLKSDKDLVLRAVRQKGYTLLHASAELKDDRDVVRTAVLQWPDSIMYASDRLKRDTEILYISKMDAAQRKWYIVRQYVWVDSIVQFWVQCTMKATFDANGTFSLIGAGAKRLRNEFETDIKISKFILPRKSQNC